MIKIHSDEHYALHCDGCGDKIDELDGSVDWDEAVLERDGSAEIRGMFCDKPDCRAMATDLVKKNGLDVDQFFDGDTTSCFAMVEDLARSSGVLRETLEAGARASEVEEGIDLKQQLITLATTGGAGIAKLREVLIQAGLDPSLTDDEVRTLLERLKGGDPGTP